MNILVTGSNGFIAKNLISKLLNYNNYKIIKFDKSHTLVDLEKKIIKSNMIFHLAGENRPKKETYFKKNNYLLTKNLINLLIRNNKRVPIIFSSSIGVLKQSKYGASKLESEEVIKKYSQKMKIPAVIYRLPNVFGKWCKPNYNSVVSTFIHNSINDLPHFITNKKIQLKLVHIDDVVESFISQLEIKKSKVYYPSIRQIHTTSVGNLSKIINEIKKEQENFFINSSAKGFRAKLFSTYLSYLNKSQISKTLLKYEDNRGIFSEILKSQNSGQFSFFTCPPGQIRGGHYHNYKHEIFLIVQGKAKFNFQSINNKKIKYSINVSSKKLTLVRSIPGYFHNIENIGTENLIVFLWSNENFNVKKPDTFTII